MADAKGLRIVVAEDDDLNLLILLKTIRDSGNNVVDFTDGNLALDYLYAHPSEVDMVILDKMMLQMHGMEVVRRMKEHDVLKNIPVIIQSGDAFPDKIKEALDAGIDRYITKPFEGSELVEIINELASQHQH